MERRDELFPHLELFFWGEGQGTQQTLHLTWVSTSGNDLFFGTGHFLEQYVETISSNDMQYWYHVCVFSGRVDYPKSLKNSTFYTQGDLFLNRFNVCSWIIPSDVSELVMWMILRWRKRLPSKLLLLGRALLWSFCPAGWWCVDYWGWLIDLSSGRKKNTWVFAVYRGFYYPITLGLYK